jgi:hypothetical protein
MAKKLKKPKIEFVMTAEVHQFFREAGKRGGKARAKNLSATERREIARKAIAARWAKREGEG